ncbi:putative aldehyde dehydrogenase [Streptomyces spectabilis]|uniref:Aldehyde dehydrogenase n=1 Tax=Streptomyces spectabilis TaxID=68270 RepID=A0A5P2X5V0_STRST|nr:aldehyde dehydrogenase [Streptomyces spectabilis]GGV08769.1 putative aldehyde dehydrogenase [Streptomyces spectabilis]
MATNEYPGTTNSGAPTIETDILARLRRDKSHPVPTYPSYVNGEEIHSEKYAYTVSGRAALEDVFASLTLKRQLEQGRLDARAARGKVVGRCAVADAATVDAAVRAAADAAPRWAAFPLERRVRAARLVRERLRRHRAELVEVLVAEGTPRALAQWQLAGMAEASGDETVNWCAGQLHQEFRHGPRRLIVRRVADGVVCVNPPQNAPAASAMFASTALLAGNALVVRAPRSGPLGVMYVLRELVAPALADVGAPPGVLNVFCARPGPVLRSWLDSPLVNDIFYTGGVERGLELQAECVARGKKPVLELAGNDCVVVWRDADLDLAAEALTEAFYGSGQICMVPNQVVAHPEIADALLERLRAAAAALRPGYPEDEGALLSPVLRSERFFAHVRDAVAQGARLVHGARRLEVDGTVSDTGPFLEPTVLRVDGLVACRDVAAVREETFFPVLPVVVPEPGSDEELLEGVIAHVNANRYGLRNSLWARDEGVIEEFVRRVGNGGLLKVNDSHIGFLPYLPTHGGTGLTGGVYGEANYLALRTSHLQGVSIADGVRPRSAVLDAYAALT